MIRTKWIGVITVCFIMVWPALLVAGEVNLPKTGQETCYDEIGDGIIDCTNTGQDGDIQAGVEWPSPRFEDNGNGTVTDNLTGLMWLKDANCFGTRRTWIGALDVVADFNTNPSNYTCTSYTANYTDWVLPNIVELESLVNAEETNFFAAWLNTQRFTQVQSTGYWSASTSTSQTGYAWHVAVSSGFVGSDFKGNNYYVWPVRGGQ